MKHFNEEDFKETYKELLNDEAGISQLIKDIHLARSKGFKSKQLNDSKDSVDWGLLRRVDEFLEKQVMHSDGNFFPHSFTEHESRVAYTKD